MVKPCSRYIDSPQINLILTPSVDPFLTNQAGKESEIKGENYAIVNI